jgi:hypothetical protein
MIFLACLLFIMGRALPVPPRQWLLTALRSFVDAAGEWPEQRWSPGWGTSLVTGPCDSTERGARP